MIDCYPQMAQMQADKREINFCENQRDQQEKNKKYIL